MKNWSRKFNPRKTAFRTPALFRLRRIYKTHKDKVLAVKQKHLTHKGNKEQ